MAAENQSVPKDGKGGQSSFLGRSVLNLFRRGRAECPGARVESQAGVRQSAKRAATSVVPAGAQREAAGVDMVPSVQADEAAASSDHQLSAFRSLPSSTLQLAIPPHSSGLEPPYTLDALEQLALAHNPTFVQAQAGIEAARGRLVQAGLYPNPSVGYTGGEIGDEGRAGQQGLFASQEIVRGGKLQLSQSVAAQELAQAEADAEAQRYRVLNTVRAAFYTTLVAERTVEKTREIQAIAEKAVEIAEQLMRAGQGSRPDVLQAEIELDQVRIAAQNAANNYAAAWRRLAAAAGVPDLEPAPLAGEPGEGIAELTGDQAFSRILAMSPELRVAEAGVRRAEYTLARAQVEPIPNATLQGSVQYDYASRDTIAGLGISFPLPIFNRNQGNVLAAQSELLRATREVDRVRLLLNDRFAATFARYQNARQQVQQYREQIIPRAEQSLALATEGYQRGEFAFLQVLTAQRTLAQVSLSYLQALAQLHASYVEIDGLLLTDGLSGPGSYRVAEDVK